MNPTLICADVLTNVVPSFAPATATLYLRSRKHGVVRAKPHGSAALLRLDEMHFVVTARHLLEGESPDDELVLYNAG